MDILSIANEIKGKVKELESLRGEIQKLAKEKADAMVDYEKAYALNLIRLKNGKSATVEGEIIVHPPVSIMDKIVKGIIYKESFAYDLAESAYKACIVKIEKSCYTESHVYSLFHSLI